VRFERFLVILSSRERVVVKGKGARKGGNDLFRTRLGVILILRLVSLVPDGKARKAKRPFFYINMGKEKKTAEKGNAN
jgi:hypothetical protein